MKIFIPLSRASKAPFHVRVQASNGSWRKLNAMKQNKLGKEKILRALLESYNQKFIQNFFSLLNC